MRRKPITTVFSTIIPLEYKTRWKTKRDKWKGWTNKAIQTSEEQRLIELFRIQRLRSQQK